MRRLLTLLAWEMTLIFSTSVMAQELVHPWEQFAGCYKTLSIDGTPVKAPRPGTELSSIQNRSSLRYYLGPDYEDLAGLDFKIFTRQDPQQGSAYYHYHAVIWDRGEFSEGGYSFEGQLRLKPFPEEFVSIHKEIYLSPKGRDSLEVLVRDYLANKEEHPLARSLTYHLKKVACFSDR